MKPIDYESRSKRRVTRRGMEIISLVLSLTGAAVAAFTAYFVWSGDLIGDAYAPLTGLFFGVPLSVAVVCGIFGPVWLMSMSHQELWHSGYQVTALLLSALDALVVCGLTLACIAAPHTHGSGC